MVPLCGDRSSLPYALTSQAHAHWPRRVAKRHSDAPARHLLQRNPSHPIPNSQYSRRPVPLFLHIWTEVEALILWVEVQHEPKFIYLPVKKRCAVRVASFYIQTALFVYKNVSFAVNRQCYCQSCWCHALKKL